MQKAVYHFAYALQTLSANIIRSQTPQMHDKHYFKQWGLVCIWQLHTFKSAGDTQYAAVHHAVDFPGSFANNAFILYTKMFLKYVSKNPTGNIFWNFSLQVLHLICFMIFVKLYFIKLHSVIF